jgi:hypothetical protein
MKPSGLGVFISKNYEYMGGWEIGKRVGTGLEICNGSWVLVTYLSNKIIDKLQIIA